MASSRPKRTRYNLDINFRNEEEKAAFRARLENVRQLLTPPGCPSVDNNTLICAMMDALEADHSRHDCSTEENTMGEEPSTNKSFLHNNGM